MQEKKGKRNSLLLGLLLIGWSCFCYANLGGLNAPLPNEEAFMLHLVPEEKSVKAQWQIAPTCYLYQEHLHITVWNDHQEQIAAYTERPIGETIADPYFGSQIIYKQWLDIPIPLLSLLPKQAPHLVSLKIDYQGCAESGYCYPPTTQWFDIHIKAGKIQSALPKTTIPNVNAAVAKVSTEKTPKFSGTILSFYFLGILLTFTPCVLPMLPILCSVIIGEKHLNTRKAFWLSLIYVLAMAFTYAVAGIMVALLGKNLQATLQKPAIIITFALFFIYLGLIQLGWGRFIVPPYWKKIQEKLHLLHMKQQQGSYVGAAIMGVLSTLIASPCVSAPLIGALSYISHQGNLLLGGSALLALGLGMGTFLLIIGTLGGKYLPKKGKWMHRVNQVFALIMFSFSIWLISHLYHPHAHGQFETIQTLSALQQIQEKDKQQGLPTVVVFYADWCTACKRLERDVLTTAIVQDALQGWDLVQANVTAYDTHSQHLLHTFDLIGPPAVLFFDKKGSELTKYRLMGDISAPHLAQKIECIRREMEQ